MSLRKAARAGYNEVLDPGFIDGGGSHSSAVAVLLDDSAESWHALFAALTVARRDGRDMHTFLVRPPSWLDATVNALQACFTMTCDCVPTSVWTEIQAEYDDALRAQGFGVIEAVTTKRQLIRDLTATPTALVVTSMMLGRKLQGPLGRCGQAMLLVP